MLASIIIPNYNYGAYVGQAIDSALRQSHSPVEVIVVDDGSTDNSRDVIVGYGNRIQYVFQPNGGQGSAFNTGWCRAKGEVVMFLDADDVLLSDAVKKCVATLLESNALKAQFLLGRVDKDLGPIGGVLPTYPLGSAEDIKRDLALWGYYPATQTSGNAFRRDFLEKVMPVPDFKPKNSHYDVAPDAYLSGLAGLTGRVVSIREVLALYRIHGKNISEAGKLDTLQKLRWLFMQDYIREQHQKRYASTFGVSCKFDLARFHPAACKMRFLSYRIDREDHPVPDDTYGRLLASGLRGALLFPYSSPRKRLFAICGFLALAVLPPSMLSRMIGAVTKPGDRRGLLSLRGLAALRKTAE